MRRYQPPPPTSAVTSAASPYRCTRPVALHSVRLSLALFILLPSYRSASVELTPWTMTSDSIRTIDGTDNNPLDPLLGSAGRPLLRVAQSDYGDGIAALAGTGRQGPRELSNVLADQSESVLNRQQASDWVWQWGQFLDHDLDLTPAALPEETADIQIPAGDPVFDAGYAGNSTMPFVRSIYDPHSGTDRITPRQQLNMVTSFIDASNVYGSDAGRAHALRTNDGTGKLKTSSGGQFLPLNTTGLPNAGGPDPGLFLAGDVRANEHVGLTATHTLFVREHNRLCDEIRKKDPLLEGEAIYQQARKIVGAEIQVITYRDFLPILLGPNAIPAYRGYDPQVDPTIANEFSTAAYRSTAAG